MNRSHLKPAVRASARRVALALLSALMLVTLLPLGASAQPDPDPRIGLGPASTNDDVVGKAAWNMERLAHELKPAPVNGTNSDLAFTGDYVISGNYNGFNVYDVSDPSDPELVTSVLCPGSQNDVSVYGDLLFMSVEATSAKIDCTTTPAANAQTRFRGVRIWDISDIRNPVQLPGIQTCRGSHTHTVVTSPNDPDNVYVYVSGTAGQRAAAEFVHTPQGYVSGRCGQTSATSANPSQWMIEVIKVPLAAPETASVVTEARLFADPVTGAVNGLQNGAPPGGHPCNRDSDPAYFCNPAGTGYSPTPNTNTCHDITSYPALGIAAGACQGNGILIDITDPANPKRLDAVADQNFSYWHSATLNNDGTKVVFTDEWGGGSGARCMANHRKEWGANAIYDIVQTEDGPKMEFASYYKLPVPQTAQENCVAHNGNLVPVPNRDIMVQAWYQGGTSLWDFTDSSNPVEIGYFDYAPNSAASLQSGGFWSSYWYNGYVYGNEIARGFDTFQLLPNELLTENELAVARSVTFDESNAQHQDQLTWDITFTYGHAHLDQLSRDGAITEGLGGKIRNALDKAEEWLGIPGKELVALSHFDRAVHLLLWQADVIEGKDKPNQGDADRLRALADTIAELKANNS